MLVTVGRERVPISQQTDAVCFDNWTRASMTNGRLPAHLAKYLEPSCHQMSAVLCRDKQFRDIFYYFLSVSNKIEMRNGNTVRSVLNACMTISFIVSIYTSTLIKCLPHQQVFIFTS